jgi:hypothetical protein
MPVATDTDLDNNSSINNSIDNSADNRNNEIAVLDNPVVRRSAQIQRNVQIQQDAPRPRRFKIVPLLLTNKQRREYVRYKEDDEGNQI